MCKRHLKLMSGEDLFFYLHYGKWSIFALFGGEELFLFWSSLVKLANFITAGYERDRELAKLFNNGS